MNENNYLLGTLLIFIGILFLLLNFSIITFNSLVFLLSIALIVGYFVRHERVYLILGSILFIISSVSLLDGAILPNISIKSFLFLSIFGIIALAIYLRENNKAYLILSGLLISLGFYNLISKLSSTSVIWVFFLLVGISFFIIYLVGYRRSGIEWPKNISLGMLILALILWLSTNIRGKLKFKDFIVYFWPILLILIGGKILYNIVRSRN